MPSHDLKLQQAADLARHGDVARAETLLRELLRDDPRHPVALRLVAEVLRRLGRVEESIETARTAAQHHPANVEVQLVLAGALLERRAQSADAEAAEACRRALALDATNTRAMLRLAAALERGGDRAGAIAQLRQAIAIQPNYLPALNNLAVLQQAAGEWEAALSLCERIIGLQPTYLAAHLNRTAVLSAMGCHADALVSAEASTRLDECSAAAWSALSLMRRNVRHFAEAIDAARQAISLDPGLGEAHNNLAAALSLSGRSIEAIAAGREAIRTTPNDAVAHSNLLLNLHYPDDIPPDLIAAEHRHWAEVHETVAAVRRQSPVHADHQTSRRLRIGYVSADFRTHSVSHFIAPLLAAHDRETVEVFGYDSSQNPDSVTAHLQSLCDGWRRIRHLPDEEAARKIIADRIDILVDLSGHTADNRLTLFALRPAPVQVTYLGYPDTTGLRSIDYRLVDAITDPPGLTDGFGSEQLMRLPRTFLCYSAPESAPSPCKHQDKQSPITFGSFNNLAKVTPHTLALWAAAVRSVRDSRLLIKAPGLDDAASTTRIREALRNLGLSPGQIDLRGTERTISGHLATYNEIDIALDTFPYHGTTTTCEALWMATPVVTLAGKTHVSRVGVSLLHSMGMNDLVADSDDAFVEIARSLADDRDRLEAMRSSMRSRMRSSALMDAPRFAADVEQAYHTMCNA